MKAVVFDRYGPPDGMRIAEIDRPEPGEREILIRVFTTAVNDWDWGYVRGKPWILRLMFGVIRPKWRVLGAEVAGIVEAVGPGATAFRPGDRVYGDLSGVGFGGFAEYVSVREDALVRIPEGMSFVQAAAIPHAAGLAIQAFELGGLEDGERVLINGAGGGVGTIGVQLAKTGGSEVTGVDAAFKHDLMREFGFDRTIDYRREDFTRRGERYDLILDTKTTRSPFAYLRALRPGGRYVTVGGALPRLLQAFCLDPLLSRMTGKRTRVLGLEPNRGLDRMDDLFREHGLRCAIDGPYPLEDVPRAVARFGRAEHLGKIVIRVADEPKAEPTSTPPPAGGRPQPG